jgi:hypothetical protein
VSVESSAQRHSPFEVDQNPCRTNIDLIAFAGCGARLTGEGEHATMPRAGSFVRSPRS